MVFSASKFAFLLPGPRVFHFREGLLSTYAHSLSPLSSLSCEVVIFIIFWYFWAQVYLCSKWARAGGFKALGLFGSPWIVMCNCCCSRYPHILSLSRKQPITSAQSHHNCNIALGLYLCPPSKPLLFSDLLLSSLFSFLPTPQKRFLHLLALFSCSLTFGFKSHNVCLVFPTL